MQARCSAPTCFKRNKALPSAASPSGTAKVHRREATPQLGPTPSTRLETGQSSLPSFDLSRIAIHSPRPRPIQRRAVVQPSNDIHEREADEVAERVLAMGEPQTHNRLAGRSSAAPAAAESGAPPLVDAVLRAPGRPLDPATRAFMEPRFGFDFSKVRVHDDGPAAESARSIGALAYTGGQHIAFDTGNYEPGSASGRRLVAHELTHVVQQAGTGVRAGAQAIQRKPQEREAGPREAVVEVRWTEDEDQFFDRLLRAVSHSAGFRGIDPEEFNYYNQGEPGLRAFSDQLHMEWSRHHPDRRPGTIVKVRVAASYRPDHEFHASALTGKKISLVDDQPSPQAAKNAPAANAAVSPDSAAGAPSSPGSQPSIKDQEASLIRMYAQLAAQADREGALGMVFQVTNNGKKPNPALSPYSMERLGPPKARPAGVVGLTESGAARELQTFMDVVAEHQGQWRGKFIRDERSGVIHFQGWMKIADAPLPPLPAPPPGRTLSPAEQFEREVGMRYPQRINQQLHDIAAKALKESNPFSLKNLPFTIAGIVIPIGAMKLLMMDTNELGNLVRISWEIDEDAAEAGASGAINTPAADTQVGAVIDTPAGPQRVVQIRPGEVVTEPYEPPPTPAATATTDAPATTPAAPPADTPSTTPSPTAAVDPPGTAPPRTPAGGPAPATPPPVDDNVWVQLEDGRVRAYTPSEVKGEIKVGASATTPEGKGRIVRVGMDPPHSGKVVHEPNPLPPNTVRVSNMTTTDVENLKTRGYLFEKSSADGKSVTYRHPDTGRRVEVILRRGGPDWLKPEWGRARIEAELRDRGFTLGRETRAEGGRLYRNPETTEEIRIMSKPGEVNRNEPIEKHLNDFYYRYRPNSSVEWGDHTTILNKN